MCHLDMRYNAFSHVDFSRDNAIYRGISRYFPWVDAIFISLLEVILSGKCVWRIFWNKLTHARQNISIPEIIYLGIMP